MSARNLKVVKPVEGKPVTDLWLADLARKKAVSEYLGFTQKRDLIVHSTFELKMSGFLPEEALKHLDAARVHLDDRCVDLRAQLNRAEELCFDLEEKRGVGHHNTVYLTIQFERDQEES